MNTTIVDEVLEAAVHDRIHVRARPPVGAMLQRNARAPSEELRNTNRGAPLMAVSSPARRFPIPLPPAPEEPMEEIEHLLRELRAALMEEIINLEWRQPAFITREVTAVTRRVLDEHGYATRAEVGLGYNHRRGVLDVGASREGCPAIAIEIDRSDKPRSIAKLQEAARRGLVPIWIRWGHDLPSETERMMPPEIFIVEVPIDFRRGRQPRPLCRVRPAR